MPKINSAYQDIPNKFPNVKARGKWSNMLPKNQKHLIEGSSTNKKNHYIFHSIDHHDSAACLEMISSN